jgi:phosphohistidine phosphatase
MKTLFLLRHAKSVPAIGSWPDLDRSLTDEGCRQAERVGKYLKQQNTVLDLVLSSPALRARETTQLVLTAAECVVEVRYDMRIYEASRQQLLQIISEIDVEKSSVLLVGHNPGLEEVLQGLTDCFAPMGTATLAKIDLTASEWNKITGQKGQLDWLMKPDELPS